MNLAEQAEQASKDLDSTSGTRAVDQLCIYKAAHILTQCAAVLREREGAQQAERDAFEAWCKTEGYTTASHEDGSYCRPETQMKWDAWQARAALAAAPQRKPIDEEGAWIMAMRSCGALHRDVLHMERRQVLALVSKVEAHHGITPNN